MKYTGKDILSLGFESGKHIGEMIALANNLGRCEKEDLEHLLPKKKEVMRLANEKDFNFNITATTEYELSNMNASIDSMKTLSKTPVVEELTIMPDACPAGQSGTITVGGVVASKHLHPAMHSADVCCSLMFSEFDNTTPKDVLDIVHDNTHFGAGGRGDFFVPDWLKNEILSNPFTMDLLELANSDLGTQGDGNHFSFVGTLESTGNTCLVTHHGSRRFGARVFKKGQKLAEKYTKEICPDCLKQNAWIPNDAKEFNDYWDALQIVRKWTKLNHQTIHGFIDKKLEINNFWNEHNFVFKRNGLYYHAKGATPAYKGWAEDATDNVIIPLNMAEPVLICHGLDNKNGLGFCPHGAGRNMSRTQHSKLNNHSFSKETEGLDIRSYSGEIDTSELPSAYKNADQVISDIDKFKLAKIVDKVLPYGSIMAGKFKYNHN